MSDAPAFNQQTRSTPTLVIPACDQVDSTNNGIVASHNVSQAQTVFGPDLIVDGCHFAGDVLTSVDDFCLLANLDRALKSIVRPCASSILTLLAMSLHLSTPFVNMMSSRAPTISLITSSVFISTISATTSSVLSSSMSQLALQTSQARDIANEIPPCRYLSCHSCVANEGRASSIIAVIFLVHLTVAIAVIVAFRHFCCCCHHR